MKIRMKSATGFVVSEAVADATRANGSPLVVVLAAVCAATEAESCVRRVAATAAHANGPAAGPSPPLPVPSHDSRVLLNPVTAPRGESAVMNGAPTAAGAATGAISGEAEPPDGVTTAVGVEGTRVATSGTGAPTVTDGRRLAKVAEPPAPGTSSTTTGVEFRRSGPLCAPEPPRTPDRAGDVEPLVTPLGEEPSSGPTEAASGSTSDPLEPALPEDSARVPGRAPPRDTFVLGVFGAGPEVDDDESETPEPDEPAEPVVSAKATGAAATAEPTPRATASAPTRPT
jgi:hypothetical protein